MNVGRIDISIYLPKYSARENLQEGQYYPPKSHKAEGMFNHIASVHFIFYVIHPRTFGLVVARYAATDDIDLLASML
jgi:hypothetical protein